MDVKPRNLTFFLSRPFLLKYTAKLSTISLSLEALWTGPEI